jgi:putative Holliday junction resolvase
MAHWPLAALQTYNPELGTTAPKLTTGRVLALDVGKKRIGLAVSDELGVTAQGIPTFRRTRIREDLSRLRAIATDWSVNLLLVGHPIHMSGDDSRQAVFTREFADRLADYLGLPVIYWDERLTSSEAERLMRDAGASLEQRKLAVDRLSAMLLLESYLHNRSASHAQTPEVTS